MKYILNFNPIIVLFLTQYETDIEMGKKDFNPIIVLFLTLKSITLKER